MIHFGIIRGMNVTKRPSVEAFGKAVARQLSARRGHQGITQQELSDGTSISQSQLSKQLRGLRAIDLDDLEAICRVLRVDMVAVIEEAEKEVLEGDMLRVRRVRKKQKGTDGHIEIIDRDDDALIDRINAGEEQIAAQKRTDPLEENYT